MPIRLHRRARSDLDNIYRYSADRWGLDQADRYLADLTETFALLAQRLVTDRAADLEPENLRKAKCGSHFIYFIRAGDGIHIIRILHERMDPGRHLP